MIAVKGSIAGIEALMTFPLVKRLEPSTSLASLVLMRRWVTGGAGGSMFTGEGADTTITSLSSKSMLMALSKVTNLGVFGVLASFAQGEGLGVAPLGVSILLGVISRPTAEASASADSDSGSKRWRWQWCMYWSASLTIAKGFLSCA